MKSEINPVVAGVIVLVIVVVVGALIWSHANKGVVTVSPDAANAKVTKANK